MIFCKSEKMRYLCDDICGFCYAFVRLISDVQVWKDGRVVECGGLENR